MTKKHKKKFIMLKQTLSHITLLNIVNNKEYVFEANPYQQSLANNKLNFSDGGMAMAYLKGITHCSAETISKRRQKKLKKAFKYPKAKPLYKIAKNKLKKKDFIFKTLTSDDITDEQVTKLASRVIRQAIKDLNSTRYGVEAKTFLFDEKEPNGAFWLSCINLSKQELRTTDLTEIKKKYIKET